MTNEKTPKEQVTLEVQVVTGAEAEQASELVDKLVTQYNLSTEDTNALFNAMVTIFVRNRMIYGDKPPPICGGGGCG